MGWRDSAIRSDIQLDDDVTFVRDISGNSGCQVSIYEAPHGHFVRKVSSSVAYNERLKVQVDKLVRIRKMKSVSAPQIYNVAHTDDGLMFYDMELVRGETFARYILSASWESIEHSFNQVLSFIEECRAAPLAKSCTMKHAHDKVESLRNLGVVNEDLYEFFRSFNLGLFHCSFFHGDLTFENMIVDQEGNVTLIDALDAYMPSYFSDLSKLLTELLGTWSQINSGVSVNPTIHASLFDKLKAHPSYNEFERYHKMMTIIDLLRTIPYMNDEDKKRRVYEKIEEIRSE